MTIQEVVSKATEYLKNQGVVNPRLDAELLFAKAMSCKRLDLYLRFDQPVVESELIDFRQMIRRRTQKEPLDYILGNKEFYGFEFQVDPRVLIPRPETEGIVERATRFLNDKGIQKPVIFDWGVGSGCIGISILKVLNSADVRLYGWDISSDAIEVAKINLDKHGVGKQSQYFHEGIEVAFAEENKVGRADVIVGNPPYIACSEAIQAEVRNFEPDSALFSGEDGIATLRQWSRCLDYALKTEGYFIFEIGFKQGEVMGNFLSSFDFLSNIKVEKDLNGLDRYVSGRRIK